MSENTQKVEINNRLNRQVLMYTESTRDVERAYPLPPRGVRTVFLTPEQISYIRSTYGRDLILDV